MLIQSEHNEDGDVIAEVIHRTCSAVVRCN